MPRGIFPSAEVLGALDSGVPFDDLKDEGEQSKSKKKAAESSSTSSSTGSGFSPLDNLRETLLPALEA